MPSKYDYPDPGQDPAYCNGLTPELGDLDVCHWCNESYTNREYYPYCSSQCGLYAERDDRPPRTLTRQERLERLADKGVDTWGEWRCER